MKQTALLDRIQDQMRPGVITYQGLLGSETRPLGDMLDEDEAGVRRLGLTHARVAERMRDLRDAGARGLGQSVRVAPHFEVTVDSVRGKLPCPFLHEGLFAKLNTTVLNLALQRSVVYTDLNIHMIEAHGFYEGKGSDFRLEPADLAAVLEIPVARDYT